MYLVNGKNDQRGSFILIEYYRSITKQLTQIQLPLHLHWRVGLVAMHTVLTFNSCTNCVGRPVIIHDRTPDYHPVSWV